MKYGLCSLEDAKQAALDYQKTKDVKLFNKFLARFDELLIHTINEMKRRYHYLRKVEAEDMYQNAVLSLYKVILKVKEKERPQYLGYLVKKRIITELLRTYQYLVKESSKREDITKIPPSNDTTSYSSSSCDLSAIQGMIHLNGIDLDCFTRHYVNGETMESIAKDYKVGRSSVNIRLKKIVEKMRKVLGKDLKLF